MDAVAARGGPRHHLAQEDDASVHVAHRHGQVHRVRLLSREVAQFMVMRGEERPRADAVVQVLRDGPCQREPVEGAGAATDLVEQEQ